MDKQPLKVQQLIHLLLAMNPRAEVFLRMPEGELRPLLDEDVEEIYTPAHPAKTAVHITLSAGAVGRAEEETP